MLHMNSRKIFGGIDVFICISSGEIDTQQIRKVPCAVTTYNF